MPTRRHLLLAAAFAALVPACGSDPATSAATSLKVTLSNTAFTVTGKTRPGAGIEYTATGTQAHYVQIRRLNDGVTYDQALAQLHSDSGLNAVAPEIQTAPSAIVTPGHTVTITDPGLTDGNYLLLDWFPTEGVKDHFHVDDGLVGRFEVTGNTITPPTPTETYTASAGTAITGPTNLKAGRHVLQITATGDAHAAPALLRLDNSLSVDGAVEALNKIYASSPWPAGAGMSMGSYLVTAAFPSSAASIQLTTDLTPGRYALVHMGYDGDGNAQVGPERIELTVS